MVAENPRRGACKGALLGALAAGLALAAGGADRPALKELMPKGLLLGVAVSRRQVDGRDPAAAQLVARHFGSVSPENLLKWESVHPEAGRYDFGPADRYVEFGERHGLAVVGHTLVWHKQTPAWVFAGKNGASLDRAMALARMRDHIQAVVGRYRGRIRGWDVVNEALADDGSLRQTGWLQAIGDDYIAQAFRFAHEADPQAELYYNDYDLTRPDKRAAAIRIVKDLKQRGLRVDAVGEQGHWLLEGPSTVEIEAALADIAKAGVRAMITELDVDVLPRPPGVAGAGPDERARLRAETNLYPGGLPADVQQQLARRYARLFELFLQHRDQLTRVTFWGLDDAQTWLNDFPIRGRVNHPLLFDRQGQPKPAFDAVVEALRSRGQDEPR